MLGSFGRMGYAGMAGHPATCLTVCPQVDLMDGVPLVMWPIKETTLLQAHALVQMSDARVGALVVLDDGRQMVISPQRVGASVGHALLCPHLTACTTSMCTMLSVAAAALHVPCIPCQGHCTPCLRLPPQPLLMPPLHPPACALPRTRWRSSWCWWGSY